MNQGIVKRPIKGEGVVFAWCILRGQILEWITAILWMKRSIELRVNKGSIVDQKANSSNPYLSKKTRLRELNS